VLAGEKDVDEIILNGLEWYQQNGIHLRLGVRIVDVDRKGRLVIGDDGSRTPFDKLLLATGSSPFIPRIEGLDKSGVLTFRNLEDPRALIERAGPGVRAVVIGGGLLGLEAARGLQVRGADVTVVHLLDSLMNVQLDAPGGQYLKAKIEQLGVRVLTSK